MSQVVFVVSEGMGENRLFDIGSARDSCLERFVILRLLLKRFDIDCDTLDKCASISVDLLVCSDIGTSLRGVIEVIKSNPTVNILYLPTEPPVITCLHSNNLLGAMPFDRVLFWNDAFVNENQHGIKCNIGQPVTDPGLVPFIAFEQKKFISAITSSKLIKHENGLHTERFRAFEFFSQKPEGMDLYGVGWERLTLPFVKASYMGECKTKKDVLKNYKFSICFENAKGYPGLITEKIFDCFASGTVPIYYGPPNVQKYIPDGCFINFCNFASYEELYKFLTDMTEVDYQTYLDAAITFIKSKEYYEFTSKRFAEIVFEQIQSLLKEPGSNRTVLSFKWALLKIVLSHPIFFLKNLRQCRRFLFDIFFSF